MKLDTKAFEDKMKKTIAVLEEEFACIRIGRASARVLDKITVPYYGTPTAVDGVARKQSSGPKAVRKLGEPLPGSSRSSTSVGGLTPS